MKRPVALITGLALVASFVTYSPTVACNSKKDDSAIATSVEKVSGEVVIDEKATQRTASGPAVIRASLRAGVAVGKAILTTAVTAAASIVCTAHHAAVTLIESVATAG